MSLAIQVFWSLWYFYSRYCSQSTFSFFVQQLWSLLCLVQHLSSEWVVKINRYFSIIKCQRNSFPDTHIGYWKDAAPNHKRLENIQEVTKPIKYSEKGGWISQEHVNSYWWPAIMCSANECVCFSRTWKVYINQPASDYLTERRR